jgi:gliding motility-associated-like protein
MTSSRIKKKQIFAYIFLLALFLIATIQDAKSQQPEAKNISRHRVKVYKSNDSVTLQNFRSMAGLTDRGVRAIDTLAQFHFMKKVLAASSSLQKGEKKMFVVTGSLLLNVASTGTTCEDSNGSIDVIASGGTPPYTYSENGYPAQSQGYFFALAAGTYNVIATDANGTSATATVVLTNTLEQPTVSIIGYTQLSSCSSSDASVTLAGSGGLQPYTYSVDGFNFQSNNTIRNIAASYGPYGFIIKDANGCENTTGPFFYDNPGYCTLGFQIGGYNSACKNEGTIAIFAETGGTAPYQYSLDGVNYQADSTFINLPSGLYKCYVKDATGYVQMKTSPIYQYCPIVVTVAADDPPCGTSVGSLTVTASNGTPPYQYSIDGSLFQPGNVFNNLKAGRYTITVADANGAFSTVDAAIDNSCPIISSFSIVDETCSQKNGSITIIASNGVQPYQYSIDGVNFQSGNIFSNLASGQYTIIVKDDLGQIADSTMMVGSSCLVINLTGGNTTCSQNNGSITVAVSNGTSPYQYSIDGINFQSGNMFQNLLAGNYTVNVKDAAGLTDASAITITDNSGPQLSAILSQASCSNTNGSISIVRFSGTGPVQYSIDGGTTLQADSIFNNLDSGQYIAYARDANGCIATDTLHLTSLQVPVVSLGNDTTLCIGDTLTLQVPQQSGYVYQWQDNSNVYAYTVRSAGSYSVKVTNQFNCSATASINVKYIAVPVFNLGNDTTLCNGKTLLLQPMNNVQGNYLWSDGSTSQSLKINSGGAYWLRVSSSGCATSDSINISYKSSPSIHLGNDTVLCAGETIMLDATNNNSTYLWQDGSVQSTYEVSKAGTYSVKVDENGCDTSGNITVNYITKPEIFLVKDTTLCITQQLVLDADYPNSTYEWQDGFAQPQYTVSKEGTYTVQVTNTCGTTNASTTVNYENCACKFYVPTAFTPNHDGKNDSFLPKYQCIFSDYEMKVYNRWGQLVFVSRNASNGWDGSLNSQPQPSGPYVWVLSYKDNLTGKVMRKNGTVVLVR